MNISISDAFGLALIARCPDENKDLVETLSKKAQPIGKILIGMKRKVKQGWQEFVCEDCKHTWKLPTRDHLSPSGETCPGCGQHTFPNHSYADETLLVDRFGNLI